MKSLLAIAAILAPAAAGAEVVGANANGFALRHSVTIVVPPAEAFDAFTQVSQWWDPSHTYSGKSANLSLSLQPGGCFCERLDGGGGIEHMRVTYLAPGEQLVMTGALGPLLFEAVAGIMDVKVERAGGGSRLTLSYKVAGFANGGADKLAPLVDRVLAEQLARFRKFAVGRPRSR